MGTHCLATFEVAFTVALMVPRREACVGYEMRPVTKGGGRSHAVCMWWSWVGEQGKACRASGWCSSTASYEAQHHDEIALFPHPRLHLYCTAG
jgi:hypothetical protein